MDEKSEMIDRIQYLINRDTKKKSQILRELHLSTSTLSDWEKGKGNPSSSAIIKLATYFNVSTDYLLFGRERTDGITLSSREQKWLGYLGQLSDQEQEICSAFIQGVLAEKNLKENQ